MKLNKMLNKARNNKTKTTQITLKNNGLNIKIEYRPNAEGFNSQYKNNTFYTYIDNELVGDLYQQENNVLMWCDNHNKLVSNLTEAKHIEHVYSLGYIEEV